MGLGAKKWVLLVFWGIYLDDNDLGMVKNPDLAENSTPKLIGPPSIWPKYGFSMFGQIHEIL